jgi:hypothetical protein
MSRYPWRNTSEDIAAEAQSQWETPAGAQEKADAAEEAAKDYSDVNLNAHIGTGGAAHAVVVAGVAAGFMTGVDKTKLDGVAAGANHYIHPATHPPSIIAQDANNRFVTDAEKAEWNSKATGELATPSTDGLMAAADKGKLDGIQTGAETNQNAFSGVNNVLATNKTDTLQFTGGTGITITTNPANKQVTVTATGSATPGAHASSHITGGTDVIPNAVTNGDSGLMSGTDAQFVRIEGETKAGAQNKADASLVAANAYADIKAAEVTTLAEDDATTKANAAQSAAISALNTHSNTTVNTTATHGLRINEGVLEYFNGTTWIEASSKYTGPTISTENMNYYVNTATGNDSNTGLATDQAFKTIAKAISMIPYVLNHSLIINVAAGTYAEDLTIEEKTGGGWVRVTGPSGGGFILTGKVLVQRCTLSFVSLMFITVNAPAGTIGVSISYVIRLIMSNITMTTSNTQSGVSLFHSTADVSNCTISNRSRALFAQGFSQLFSNTNSGSGNTTVLTATNGSTIVKSESQPAGTTAESASSGGLIR